MELHLAGPIVFALCSISIFRWVRGNGKESSTASYPWGLTCFAYLPRFASGFLFDRYGLQLMQAASKKHGDNPYKLIRHDVDLVVLPRTVVNELAGLPADEASNILALVYDLVGGWCGLSMLKESSLHVRVTQRRITPGLAQLTGELEDEVSEAISDLFPGNDKGWVEMKPYHVLINLAARVFSRVVVGKQHCREKRWLDFAINFTENVFESLLFMRHFPPWMYPILRYTLPSVKRSINYISEAEDYLVPVFEDLIRKADEGKLDDAAEPNAATWIAQMATDGERDPVIMTHALILLALGAIHTSLFAEVNLLYDLIANPEYADMIRDEYKDVSSEGPWNTNSYHKLHKLDSMLRESQRLAPPFLIGLRRIMKKEHVFSNGVVAPEGAYVCVPTYLLQNDLEAGSESSFDGLRSYNLRVGGDGLSSSRHQFTTTDPMALGFGHGRTACPGRFLAEVSLKMVFLKLINDYDFEFVNGRTKRPPSKIVHDVVFPDSEVNIRVRRRKSAGCHF